MRKLSLWLLVSSVLGCVAPEESTVSSTLCTAEDQADGDCPHPPLPTCASLGCPYEPSGLPDIWTTCFSDVCWCWGTGRSLQCTR